ncbi:hypothetical protein FA95DRAFT_1560805 [Auriscalpium vulgare]|uniref:Uncharacterized protein n=1 Tax=Auriscalpium vulgare TaxID=40419 RepID=A0ACB8RP67_9AGAM|nr:hypothetical protein FA95DRAFT_1560805 [Auriscalpium vulgare]
MGQRHQAFVIARVRPHGDASTPPKYRCIAAFHHQWCYGTLPLRATMRFITLLKQDDNAELVRAELATLHGKYGRWGEEPRIPKVPADFVAFLLATSWSVALESEDGYASGISFANDVLYADMSVGAGADDSITIIDVTDPAAPRYCFNSIGGPPLSARQYVSRYYSVSDAALAGKVHVSEDTLPDIVTLITALNDVDMITLEMLHEAWPQEAWAAWPHYYAAPGDSTAEEPLLETPSTALPSMQLMALRAAIVHALDAAEPDTSGLEDWMWQPEMLDNTRAALRERAPFPDAGIPLLKAIVAKGLEDNPTGIDLSGFALSSPQIAQILANGAGLRNVTLSDNAVVDVEAVRHVLTVAPDVERLVLLGCPAITDAALIALLNAEPALFYRIGALVHPAFFKADGDAPYANAFSLVVHSRQKLHAFSRPYFTPEGVVDGLTVLVGTLGRSFDTNSFMNSAHTMQTAVAAAPLRAGQTWATRSTVLHPRFSLRAKRRGEGWCFLMRLSSWSSAYGFVRFFAQGTGDLPSAEEEEERTPSDLNFLMGIRTVRLEKSTSAIGEVLDLRAFLARMVADGRPAVPEDKVVALEVQIAALEAGNHEFRPLTEEDLESFEGRDFEIS